MINERAGVKVERDSRVYVKPTSGVAGHAVFGPYETIEPGKYKVEFLIEPQARYGDARDPLCALVDVVAGPERLFDATVFRSLLGEDGRYVGYFETDRPLERVEYRIYANGAEPMLLGDAPEVTRVEALAPARRRETLPEFFREHMGRIRELFAAGVGVSTLGEDVVATAGGVSFFIRSLDDMNFIGEVLVNNTYNIMTPAPACVIDIGMNIGLTTLRLAVVENVAEVHAFEPFPSTFARAAANARLNPALAPKIHMHNIGLFDSDKEATTRVNSNDSGSYSVFGPGEGETVRLQLRDAGATLRPIVEAAQANGRLVVLKVDCEGSEFAVFRSLAESGLLPRIAAFMVEYHIGWGSGRELTERLVAAGFIVVDLGRPGENGFFYAVQAAAGAR